MEQALKDKLLDCIDAAKRQITDPRERAIVVRYIEDALCRLEGAAALKVGS